MTRFPEHLPDAEAARLLARASEIDAAGGPGRSLDELRSAALEAGISSRAFDAAVGELRDGQQPAALVRARAPASQWRRFSKVLSFWALTIVVPLALITARGGRSRPSRTPARGLTREAIMLRCLPATEAVELLKPVLGAPGNSLRNSDQTPRTLIVIATPEQLTRVHAVIDQAEQMRDGSCTAPPGAL